MRSKRLTRVILAATIAGGVLISATPAWAANSGATAVSFSLAPGALAISVPATAALGAGTVGSSLTAGLGAVTVTDTRGNLVATWTATATTSTFTTGGATTDETIAKANVSYASGLATASSGLNVVLLPGQLTTLLAASMATSVTAFTLTAGVGDNSVTWNPSLVIAVPASAVAGTYSGTITHSVA
jgi:hypothetical protein